MSAQVDFEFGPYRFKRRTGLTRNGALVPVPPKELALLRLLLRLNGRVASHQTIENEIWPGQVVSSESIARCVYSLRRVLGGDRQAYIQTVPKRGYRLAVPVKLVGRPESDSTMKKSVETVPLAHSHFLEGIREANRHQPEAQARAVELFETAVQVDPGYAVALAAIADCRMYQTIRGYIQPLDGERLGRSACDRALSIDPTLASAKAALGWFEGVIRRNTKTSLDILGEVLADDPGYARAHCYRAWVFRGAGRLEESLEAARTAIRLDPHSILNTHCFAWTLFCAGHHEEALEVERRVRRDLPHVDMGHAYVAVFAAWFGFDDEAVSAGREAARIGSENPTIMTGLSYALARAGETAEARSVADAAGSAMLPRALRSHLAMTYVALGDDERAIELLSEARDEHCPFFPGALYDPRLGDLATDDRLLALYDERLELSNDLQQMSNLPP